MLPVAKCWRMAILRSAFQTDSPAQFSSVSKLAFALVAFVMWQMNVAMATITKFSLGLATPLLG